MALDTFKARLKAKTKAAGVNLSQKRIDAFADRLHKKNPDVTDDAAHDALIDALDELVAFADVAKEDDRVRTLETKASKQKDGDNPDDDPDKNKGKDKPAGDDVPAWAKSLMDEVKSLRADKQQSSIKSKLAEKLKDKVPEKFYSKRALPDKEEDLDAFVAEVETDWSELKQENNNLGLGATSVPGGTAGPKTDNVDADIEAWASKGAEAKK